MPTKVNAYSIFDIANWQTELQEKYNHRTEDKSQDLIILPTIQRGFVWKPYQIENLWDSILRGYPIGGLMMAPNELGKDLLDGQQRCTAIKLGLVNPFAPKRSIFNLTHDIPTVWIDIKPLKSKSGDRNFGVRVLTKSHPWGYRLGDHRKPLKMENRREALSYFEGYAAQSGESKLELIRIPWDSHFPIPLSFIFQADSNKFDWWKIEIITLCKKHLKQIRTRHSMNQDVSYDNIPDEWLERLYDGVNYSRCLTIPEVPVNSSILSGDSIRNKESSALFIRLNTEGTRLTNQELVYSILKSIFPQAKNIVEAINFSATGPSKLVNLFIRLVAFNHSSSKRFQREISINEFRTLLSHENFKYDLIKLIDSGKGEHLFNQAHKILSAHPSGIPSAFIKNLISNSQDLIFILLTYLNEGIEPDEQECRSIRRVFIQCHLFSLNKNREKIASSLFNLLLKNSFKNWGSAFDACIIENPEILYKLPSPQAIRKVLIEHLLPAYASDKKGRSYWDRNLITEELVGKEELITQLSSGKASDYKNTSDKTIELASAIDTWQRIREVIFRKKLLLMIVQRVYFNTNFQNFMSADNLQDTNRPWDWDHIYPNIRFRGERSSQKAKELKECVANYRALSFEDNRRQGDRKSPKQRFNDEQDRKDSFILNSDYEHWDKLDFSENELNDKDTLANFISAIFHRTNNIYSEVYHIIHEN